MIKVRASLRRIFLRVILLLLLLQGRHGIQDLTNIYLLACIHKLKILIYIYIGMIQDLAERTVSHAHQDKLLAAATCNPGYYDSTGGNAKNWACGENCVGGAFWTGALCTISCFAIVVIIIIVIYYQTSVRKIKGIGRLYYPHKYIMQNTLER